MTGDKCLIKGRQMHSNNATQHTFNFTKINYNKIKSFKIILMSITEPQLSIFFDHTHQSPGLPMAKCAVDLLCRPLIVAVGLVPWWLVKLSF
jgi:hypothetical protein